MAGLCAVVRATARTLLLILVCLLAVVSGLQIPHYYHASTRTNSSPDRSARYTAATPRAAIAIDLGNTNSCVAGYVVPGRTETSTASPPGSPSPTTAPPSSARPPGTAPRLLRFQASARAKVLCKFPRPVGIGRGDPTGHLGRSVRRAAITVPQHFHGPSAWAAMDAAKIAGLDVVRTVPEPVAAAAAHGLPGKLRDGGAALVLHVGGGTAEASVVTLMDGSLEILANRNDPFLGGDDFDRRIVDHFVDLIKAKHGEDISEDRIALRKLGMACERAKKALSSQDHAQVSIESLFGGVDFSESLSRENFEELDDDLFGNVIALVERVMSEAELERSKSKVDEIVLVGGSTMIPKIQRLVEDYFGRRKLDVRVKPDEAVAIGAAAHVHSSD